MKLIELMNILHANKKTAPEASYRLMVAEWMVLNLPVEVRDDAASVLAALQTMDEITAFDKLIRLAARGIALEGLED